MGAKYAQHFLINQHAAKRIVDSLKLEESDSVLEIGPGKGVLTAQLLKAKHVVVVDIDSQMTSILSQRLTSPALQIFNEDILKFDFSKLKSLGAVKVIGNLPYNLTSPILRRLADWAGWEFAVLMVQKEVGDRLCASIGSSDYGALTVGVQLTSEVERIFDLLPTSFSPRPKVESTVVKLTRRARPLTENIALIDKVVQAAFQQRRKTILNSLSHGLNWEKENVLKMLSELKISPTIRAERLSVQNFIDISRLYHSSISG